MRKDDKPISLYPLKPEAVLKAMLQTPPPPKAGKGKPKPTK
jgi:hypothetical protein